MKMDTTKTDSWAIPALFLIMPYTVLSMGLIWKSHHLFFITMGMVILASLIKNMWVKAFLAYAFLWQIVVFVTSLKMPFFNPGQAFTLCLSIMMGGLVFWSVVYSKIEKEQFYNVIRMAVMIQCAIGFLQIMGLDPVPWVVGKFIPSRSTVGGQFVGTLGNRNFMAAFIAMSLPMFLNWKIEPLFKITAVIAVLLSLISCTGAGVIAGFFAIAVYYRADRWTILVTITISIVYLFFYLSTMGSGHIPEILAIPGMIQDFATGKINAPGDPGRFGMSVIALSKLSQSWLTMIFGCGPGTDWGRPYPMHNEYMTAWFHFGLVGLGLVIAYVVGTIRHLRKSQDRVLMASFTALVIDMGGNYTMEVATTAFMALIICGLIERERANG